MRRLHLELVIAEGIKELACLLLGRSELLHARVVHYWHEELCLGHLVLCVRLCEQHRRNFKLLGYFYLEAIDIVVFIDNRVLEIWAELIHVHIFRSNFRHLGCKLLLHHRQRLGYTIVLGNLSRFLDLFNWFLFLSWPFLVMRRIKAILYFDRRHATYERIRVVDQEFSFGVFCNFEVNLRLLNYQNFNLCQLLFLFQEFLISSSICD